MNYDENLYNVLFSTSLASEGCSVSGLRGTILFPIFLSIVVFPLEIQLLLLLLLFEALIIFIKLGLEFGLKVIFRVWNFRGEINHFIFIVL